ncbi:MAG TPA: hypothetical protein VES40_13900 [Ilumatobacteraceae bacterium]|nr:hypothetical protein [Ilumatobacteraceae bacterium]
MSGLPILPRATLSPLRARIDDVGIIEHARGPVPAPEFGHCIDDAGRALGLAGQLWDDPDASMVAAACLLQLEASWCSGRGLVLRLDADGRPTGDPLSDDGWARMLWGLAHASTGSLGATIAQRSAPLLAALAGMESSQPRAAAHAVLAGVVLLRHDSASADGARLVDVNAGNLPVAGRRGSWMWPEPRLTYGNTLVVEALLAVAALSGDEIGIESGLELLDWLVSQETSVAGNLSFTPVGGRGPGEPGGFDQQPLEAWTLADAAREAYRISPDKAWVDVANRAAAWFGEENDLGLPMWDPVTGAAFDGLTAVGVNLNQGAESTRALIGTVHAAEVLASSSAAKSLRRSSSR